jgi:hypothetical protein
MIFLLNCMIYYWSLAGKQKPCPHCKFAVKGYDLNAFEWVLTEEQDIEPLCETRDLLMLWYG